MGRVAATGLFPLLILLGTSLGDWGIDRLSVPARAAFHAAARYVFVPLRHSRTVTVVEKSTDRVIGMVHVGLVPNQMVASEAAGKLAAIDGSAAAVSVVDLASGQDITLRLPFAPQRLVMSPDGYMVAAVNADAGAVAFLELTRTKLVSQLEGLSPIRDVMFGPDGAFLYLAAERLSGIGVLDVARGKLIEQIALPALRVNGITSLTRAPNGRIGYAKMRDERAVNLFDLSNFKAIRQVEVAHRSDKVFPTGSGGYLIAPDSSEKTVTIVANASLTVVGMLPGAAQMTTVYSGWFDTLALVPSAAERRLLVFDLDRIARAPDILLPGVAGPGAVTPDGSKLYLALEEMNHVAVVDLQSRKLNRMIALAGNPIAAIMTKSFDICH